MKRQSEEKTDSTDVQTSVEIDAEVKTAFAKQYLAWKARGWKKADFIMFLSEAGYSIPVSSLTRWVAGVKQQGNALSQMNGAGRPRTLSEEETHLLVGYVLDRNSKKQEVHLETVQKFISDNFDTNVTLRTVLNYLTAQGFTSRVAKGRDGGVQLDLTNLSQIAFQWLLTSPIHCPTNLLCSLDFTFTSHRTDRRVSYALKGGPQPEVDTSISRFTNCIITCIWADGINRTPSVLYTYNKEFWLDRKKTARRDAQLEKMENSLKLFNISPNRVVYVGEKKEERRTYVSESPQLLRLFFKMFKVPLQCTILTDNGRSFVEEKEDVLLKLGFASHLCYPAVVHQYLSPNDNKFHGAAKQKWRKMGLDFSDDVTSSIALLHCLDECTCHIPVWFEKNLQLGSPSPMLDQVVSVVGDYSMLDHDHFQECLEKFRVWMGMDARGHVPDAPPGLDSSLDGKFWRT